MIQRYLLALLVSLVLPCAMPALDVNTLSQAERQQLQAQLEQASKPVEVRVREEAAQWATLGTNVGHAMVGAAKELGMAASEFSQTGLGKVVVAIVVLKVMGGAIMHLLAGALVAAAGALFFWYVHRRILLLPQYSSATALWGLWTRRVVTQYEENDSSNRDGWNAVSVLVLAVSAIASTALIATAF